MTDDAAPPPDHARPRHFRLTLSYDGTDFFGWQVQPDRRTVQGEVEKALGTLLHEPVRIVGAGRTDRGVHALGQVASFGTEKTIPLGGLHRGLNALLPADVRVTDAQEASPDFNARYAALSRRYVYRISRREDPFRRRTTWFVPDAPGADVLAAASGPLAGRHAFDSFTSGEGLLESTTCTVQEIAWREEAEGPSLAIEADRFLYRMVRTIAGCLVQLHRRGRLDAASVAEILAARRHDPVLVPAPPNGLFLVAVRYPGDTLPAGPVWG